MLSTEAKIKTIRELGFTVGVKDGEWRITPKGAPESAAYYTDDLDDALGTARLMAKPKCSHGWQNWQSCPFCQWD